MGSVALAASEGLTAATGGGVACVNGLGVGNGNGKGNGAGVLQAVRPKTMQQADKATAAHMGRTMDRDIIGK